MEMVAGAFPWLIFAVTLLQQVASIKSSMASSRVAKPGCIDRCGNLTIPYPFGIGPDCSKEGFDVSCEDNRVFMHNSSNLMEIYDISLLRGQVRVSTLVATKCFNYSDNDTYEWVTAVTAGSLFTISSKENKLTVLGCNTLAFLGGYSYADTGAGCFTMCADNQSVDRSGQCTGMGCCQTSIAPHLIFSNITFDERYSEERGFNPCSYAFIAAHDWFKFEPSYLEGNTFIERFKDGVPAVLDWVAGEESCDEAVKNASSYACISKNGQCITSPNVTAGYICTCNDGFQGNPYLEEGCKDIDECDDRVRDQFPCHGTCTNTFGNYSCSCPPGTNSRDPKTEDCKSEDSGRAYQIKTLAGISASAMLLLICIFALVIQCQRRKLTEEKDRFFQENGGLLLYEEIRSKQVDTVRIFTTKELKNATNNFDASRELGKGGHGTVYKGILKDNRVVAIKRSKIMNLLEKDQFVQEMVILSQINHRNVVKLLGCCLEVEVPMLVYECIPNGTLFELIHGRNIRSFMSLDTRLRIAQESAEALAYLHSSASPPIVHGDIKSPNILLGNNYTAKVTDFGASRMIHKDEIQFMTMIQGTLGYLDPEYIEERKLTEKSDVYSFGVVLLELITRKMAIYRGSDGEKENLASSFLLSMKENCLQSILDKNILVVNEELIHEVTQLAEHCLRIKGEERPLMTEVSQRLKIMRSTWKEELIQSASEQTQCFPENPSHYDPSSIGYYGGLITLDLETGR